MTLPTETPVLLSPSSVGVRNGDSLRGVGIAVLDSRVEFMRFCSTCECEQMFVAGWECASGLVGCCLGCGDERIAGFSRTTAEVA